MHRGELRLTSYGISLKKINIIRQLIRDILFQSCFCHPCLTYLCQYIVESTDSIAVALGLEILGRGVAIYFGLSR
jgi:hypothetical protein